MVALATSACGVSESRADLRPEASIEDIGRRLGVSLARQIDASRLRTVVVLPFENLDGTAIGLGVLLSDAVSGGMLGARGLTIVERERLDAMLEEQERSFSGLFDSENLAGVGELLGATVLVLGRIDPSGDPITISAKAVEVETGEILVRETSSLPKPAVGEPLLQRVGIPARTLGLFEPGPRVSVSVRVVALYLGHDRRSATAILELENPSDQPLDVAFAKFGFGKCDIRLVDATGAVHYAVFGDDPTIRSVGSGGLACVVKDDPRSAYSRLESHSSIQLPVSFKARNGAEIAGDRFRTDGTLAIYQSGERREVEIRESVASDTP